MSLSLKPSAVGGSVTDAQEGPVSKRQKRCGRAQVLFVCLC